MTFAILVIALAFGGYYESKNSAPKDKYLCESGYFGQAEPCGIKEADDDWDSIDFADNSVKKSRKIFRGPAVVKRGKID